MNMSCPPPSLSLFHVPYCSLYARACTCTGDILYSYKKIRIKKEKKVWEESCFQESKFVPVTPIVFCLSVDLDQSEALISF
jgi:hypothetical protein